MTHDAVEEAPKWPGAILLGNTAQDFVLEALGAMPSLFFGAAFLLVLLTILNGVATGRWLQEGNAWIHGDVYASTAFAWLVELGRTIVCACVAVAVHRFILLRENTSGIRPLGHRYTWLFVLWAVGLNFLYLLAAIPVPIILRLMIAIGLFVVGMRLSLVFPAVAIEMQSGDIFDRIRRSWDRTRGKVLLLVLAYLVAVVPVLVVLIVTGFVVGLTSMIWSDTHPSLSSDLIDVLLKPVGVVAGAACAAAVASYAYSTALSVESIGERPSVSGSP